MPVKQRLTEFIKSLKIGQGTFEREVGLSNGYVNNIRKSIQPDKLQKIALRYPELNAGWLMTGEGEMLRDGGSKPEMGSISIPREVWEVIQNQAASLSTKDQQVSKVISLLEEQIKKGGVGAGEKSAAAM